MARKLLLCLVFVFIHFSYCYPLDWLAAHKLADSTTVANARAAVEKSPDSKQDTYILALVYLNAFQIDNSQKMFDRLYALDSDSIEAAWGRAEIMRRKHDLVSSKNILIRIIKENPQFYPAYISLSYIKYTEGDYREALILANKVLRAGKDKVDLSNVVRAYLLFSGNSGMIANNGGLIAKIMNGPSVFSNLKRAQALQPKAAGVLFALGSFYLLAPKIAGGDMAKAESYFLETVKLYPSFADAYVRLAQLYKLKGDQPRYKAYLEKAFEIDPKGELVLDEASGKCQFICPVMN